MKQEFFNLQKGEKIIKDTKPLPVYRTFMFVTWAILSLFIVGFAFIFIPVMLAFFIGVAASILVSFVLFAAMIWIIWLLANNAYSHQHYWITDKRVIYKRGILGYRISSIPLERISDVVVSRTFIERLFGFGSVHIQSLAGQFSYGQGGLGSEGDLSAVPEPEKIQELVFGLISKKRKREKLTM